MFSIFVLTLASIAINYLIWYLNKDDSKQKNKPPSKDQYNFPTADQTRPIPKFWGTIKLNSPNVCAFQITSQERIVIKTKSLFGTEKTETPNFKTYVDMHLALALTDEQQGAKLKKILVNDIEVWNNSSNAFGDVSSSINQPDFFGEDNGISGSFDFMSGKTGQTANSYLVNRLYDNLGFKWRKLSHIVFKNFYVGNSTSIAPFSFILEHAPTPHWANDTYSNFDGDCNPAVVIYYMLTEYFAGGRIKESKLDLQSFIDCHVKLYNERLGISLLRQESSSIETDIYDILEVIDGQLYTDLTTGKMTLSLNRADYEIDDLLHLELNKNIQEYESSNTSATTTVSEIRATYTNKDENFVQQYQIWRNEQARFKKEKGEVKTLNFDMITKPSLASKIARREGEALTSSLIKLNLTTDRSLSTKNIGDVVKISIDKLGIYETPFKITKINYGSLKNLSIKVELIQDLFGKYNAIFSETNPNTSTSTSAEAVQSNLKIINAPSYFNKNLNVTNNLILTFAEKPNNRQLNYDLYTKRGTNDYKKNGTSSGFSYVANLENNIEIPDDEIVVNSNNFNIQNYGIDLLNNGYNLALIYDETNNKNEFINFEYADYNSSLDLYTLKNVNRGLLDTIPQKFTNSTTKIYVFSYGYAINNLEFFNDSELIKVKSINKTVSNTQDFNDATEFNFTVSNRHKKPINVSNLKVDGVNFTDDQIISHDNDVYFQWSYRNKISSIQYYNEVNNLNNDGNSVRIKLYDISNVLLSDVTLSANETSWAWTHESSSYVHRLHYIRAEIYTIKDLIESEQKYDIIIRRID
jgi:hypothetical protein